MPSPPWTSRSALVVTTASPNYEPVLEFLVDSLEQAGFTGQLSVHRTPPLEPPFGAFTASYHAAILASMTHLLEQLERAATNSFVIKTDADIQFFSPFCDALDEWTGRMEAEGLDMLLMREGARMDEVNGGFYIIRVSARTRNFVSQLVERCAAASPSYVPGGKGPKMFDQFHLNQMLGLHAGVAAWDPAYRYAFLPLNSIIWGDDIGCGRDLREAAFHHAVCLHGVPEKLLQMRHVAAAVRLRCPDSKLVGALNAGTTELRGGRVALLPYESHHVPSVYRWLQQDGMRKLLGHSEPWSSLEDELSDQTCLAADPTRIGWVIAHASRAAKGQSEASTASHSAAPAAATPDTNGMTSANVARAEDGLICGNLMGCVTLCPLEEECEFTVMDDGVCKAAQSVEGTNEHLPPHSGDQQPLAMEVDIMVGSETARGTGLATEALQLFLSYVAARLPELRYVCAKLHDGNDHALRFFERNGMHVHKHSPLLEQIEMRLVLDADARGALDEQWRTLGGGANRLASCTVRDTCPTYLST